MADNETPTNAALLMDRGIPIGNSSGDDGRRALHTKIKNNPDEPIYVAVSGVEMVIGAVTAYQGGQWDITNVTGNIVLPNGASTSALQNTGNSSLGSIDTKLSGVLSVSGTVTANAGTGTFKVDGSSFTQPVSGSVAVNNFPATQNVAIVSSVEIEVKNDSGNPLAVSGTVTSLQGSPPWSVSQSGTWNLNNITGTITLPTGAASSALQSAGNATLSSIQTNQTNGTQQTKITDGTNIMAVKAASASAAASDPSSVVALSPNSPVPSGSNNIGSLTNITGVISLPTGASTSALQTAGNNSLSSIDAKLVDNFGAASGALRAAAQLGNQNGSADFNAGTTSAQTLRTSSNVTRNGTELSYNFGSSDANTLRSSIASSNFFHPVFSLKVQSLTGNSPGLATSLSIPISSTASGNFIAVMVSSSVAGTVTVTDNLTQTYLSAISGTSGTHTNHIFYKANTASGVTSVTINSTTSSGIAAIVVEYSGISTVSPLDKTSTNTVTGVSSFSSGSTATTTSATELLIGSAHGTTKNNQTYTAGTGWTSVGTSNGFNAGAGQLYVEDQYVSSVGSYSATGTASGNDTIIGNIATFVITNSNITVVNQPKLIKSGAGVLRRIIINTIGTGSPTVTIYDNTTNSGTVIAVLSLTLIGSLDYNLNFTNGLTIVASSTTGDFTLVYD